ncbi:MAG: hypothetical protein VX278_06440 [Myxococcota bacterium]|nr:hypothetical protein [Myxococcota bacterium]
MSEPVLVYGSDHSPWVQTVLLALEHRCVPYQIVQFPISISSYLKHGMVMPVCRWPDGHIITDSFAILAEIDKRHSESGISLLVPPEDPSIVASDQSRLELFFLLYVLARFEWGNKGRFVHVWAKTAPQHPSPFLIFLSHAFRATMTLYFILLIQGGIWSQTRKRKAIYKKDLFLKEWSRWCGRLGDSPFFGGDTPHYLDFALLGQIQCISSGLTDEVFSALRQEPAMMHWLERMHTYLPNYPRMYSKRFFSNGFTPTQTSVWGIIVFYMSLILQFALAPLPIVFLLHAFSLRNRNPARTMGKLQRPTQTSLGDSHPAG